MSRRRSQPPRPCPAPMMTQHNAPSQEQDRRWSEGYAAVEYEILEQLEDVKHPARSLWLAGRIWSSRKAKDGLIPCARLRSIGSLAGLSMRGATSAAAELEKAGLWERLDD